MNLQEALDKLASVLPGAEKAKQLEGRVTELEGQLASANKSAKDFEGQAATQKAEHEKALKAKDDQIAKLKEENATAKAEVEAKEKDVERRANLKAAEIAKSRGFEKPIDDEEEGGKGGAQSKEQLLAEYNKIEDPQKAAEFFKKHEKALLG